ncbi:MAG: rhomboid family intramembrane serine protease [Chitinophagales bacterium]|nr:rhomboid family intramembrane serine protease [Chitinophagales bacterium]
MNQSIWQELKYRYQNGGMITRLIFINLIVFVAYYGGVSIIWLFDNAFSDMIAGKLMSFISLPEDPATLVTRPWTFFTYMFMHSGLWHILFNLLVLYWFGSILTNYLSDRKVLPIYIYGGLFSGLLFIAAYNFLPTFASVNGTLIGASGAVLAIVFAAATLVPDHSIHLLFVGAVRIKYIALIILLLQFINLKGGNAGGNFAHIGGALFGFLFIKQLQNGRDWSIGFNWAVDKLSNLLNFNRKAPRIKIVYSDKEKASRKWVRKSKNKAEQTSRQDQIDQILDKINQSGYESLSKEEKDFLFRASREVKDE